MAIRSGELAKRAGVSTDTLRHYERVGVLPTPARGSNNYRIYPDAALARTLLIRRALAFGFSLAELGLVLKERDKGGAPCRKVRALAADKLASTEIRLLELTRLRDDLRSLLENWDERLHGAPKGAPAHLLESLTASFPSPSITENTHEPRHSDSGRQSRPLAGHWSQRGASPKGDESPGKRTPARGRKKR